MGSIIKKNDYVELIKSSSSDVVELRLTVDDAYIDLYMLLLKNYARGFYARGFISSWTTDGNILQLKCDDAKSSDLECQEMQARI